MRILTESTGTPTYSSIIDKLYEAGHYVVATDIDPLAIGIHKADKGTVVPPGVDGVYYYTMRRICIDEKIDMILPSFDEALIGWGERRKQTEEDGTKVLLSSMNALRVCQDKWKTFRFFKKNNIPTPNTSKECIYRVVKLRVGRGAKGYQLLRQGEARSGMSGKISQEYIEGREFTTDILCDLNGEIVRMVTRERLQVVDGKSFRGVVIEDWEIEHYIEKITSILKFVGFVNIQCIKNESGIYFIEINPRISGGLPLSLAATDNWFRLLDSLYRGQSIYPCEPKIGLKMIRYWSEYYLEAQNDKLDIIPN